MCFLCICVCVWVKMREESSVKGSRDVKGVVKGIDLVAGGRSKALVADRQASMTHYIWRPRRTRKEKRVRDRRRGWCYLRIICQNAIVVCFEIWVRKCCDEKGTAGTGNFFILLLLYICAVKTYDFLFFFFF